MKDFENHLCVSTVDIQCETPFRFRCGNNRCIYSHELCNSVDDCGDGSDEKQENCTYEFNSAPCFALSLCFFGGFVFLCLSRSTHCRPLIAGVCYPSACEGQSPTHGPCTNDEHKCSNGQCIPQQYLCDDYDDCGDQSDELGCREYSITNMFKW